MPVCLNHTDREATTRCVCCFKPLCQECVTRRGRDVFCSPECEENHLRTSGSISRFASRERALRRRNRLHKVTFVLVALLVAIIACLVILGGRR